MARPLRERLRIHRHAKELLGHKVKQSDRYIFMQQCIEQITSESDSDESEARDICEVLWEEGSDLFD